METSQIYLKTNHINALSGLKLSKTYGLYLQFIGVWLLLQVAVLVIHSSPVLTGGLVGTDSYMRLVRLTELLANGQWYDSTIARSNAPYGEVLHWTRPFDVLLIILAAPVALFTGWQSGLYWASVVVSPFLLLSCGLSLIWAMAPLLRPNRWLLPAIAIFIQPAILTYSLLGRADHHGLLLLVFVFYHLHQFIYAGSQRLLLDQSAQFISLAGLEAALVNSLLGMLAFHFLDRFRRTL